MSPLGSGITIRYATEYPQTLNKIILCSGSPQFVAPPCNITPPCVSPCVCIASETCCTQPNCTTCYPFASSLLLELQSCIETSCVATSSCLSDCDPTTPTSACLDCVTPCVAPLALVSYTDRCTSPAQQQLVQEFIALSFSPTLGLPPLFGDGYTRAIQFNIANNALSENQVALLKKITVPTLIAYGSVDLNVDPRNSLFMHKHINGSKLVQFKNRGHQFVITAAKQLNKLIKQFIKGKKLPAVIDGDCTVCMASLDFPLASCGFPPSPAA